MQAFLLLRRRMEGQGLAKHSIQPTQRAIQSGKPSMAPAAKAVLRPTRRPTLTTSSSLRAFERRSTHWPREQGHSHSLRAPLLVTLHRGTATQLPQQEWAHGQRVRRVQRAHNCRQRSSCAQRMSSQKPPLPQGTTLSLHPLAPRALITQLLLSHPQQQLRQQQRGDARASPSRRYSLLGARPCRSKSGRKAGRAVPRHRRTMRYTRPALGINSHTSSRRWTASRSRSSSSSRRAPPRPPLLRPRPRQTKRARSGSAASTRSSRAPAPSAPP